MPDTNNVKPLVSVLLFEETRFNPTLIWGLTGEQRLQRILKKHNVHYLTPSSLSSAKSDHVLILNTGYAYDAVVIGALIKNPQTTLFADDNTPVAANVSAQDAPQIYEWLCHQKPAPNITLNTRTADTLVKKFNSDLRKRETPYCCSLAPEITKQTHHTVFMGTYKGVTDAVTKYLWPRPAMVVTHWCINWGISPNAVTVIGVILMFAALFLFAAGHFGLGLFLGWIFTFLDTVDGKLARVQFTSSKFGHVLDHGTDLLHPPFWYAAWVYGLHHMGMPISALWESILLAVIVGGYVFQRLQEGYFIMRFSMHMHIWRRFDSFFRLITARRNPNMVFMTLFALMGRPDLSIWALALWTGVCLVVHMEQIISAEFARLQGQHIDSWLSKL